MYLIFLSHLKYLILLLLLFLHKILVNTSSLSACTYVIESEFHPQVTVRPTGYLGLKTYPHFQNHNLRIV